jgi:hypothetical protein
MAHVAPQSAHVTLSLGALDGEAGCTVLRVRRGAACAGASFGECSWMGWQGGEEHAFRNCSRLRAEGRAGLVWAVQRPSAVAHWAAVCPPLSRAGACRGRAGARREAGGRQGRRARRQATAAGRGRRRARRGAGRSCAGPAAGRHAGGDRSRWAAPVSLTAASLRAATAPLPACPEPVGQARSCCPLPAPHAHARVCLARSDPQAVERRARAMGTEEAEKAVAVLPPSVLQRLFPWPPSARAAPASGAAAATAGPGPGLSGGCGGSLDPPRLFVRAARAPLLLAGRCAAAALLRLRARPSLSGLQLCTRPHPCARAAFLSYRHLPTPL